MPDGVRRTTFEDAPTFDMESLTVQTEKEPMTILCSENGWIRAIKGHISADTEVKYKEGDKERFRFPAYSTDKLVVFTDGGKAYTINVDKLPSGRSAGEPIRLLAELPAEQNIISLFVYEPKGKILVASCDGRGFIVPSDDILASTKTGKQILTSDSLALLCIAVTGDYIACIGENRKMVIFPLTEIPEMSKGKGVILQKYKDGGLSDAVTFSSTEGLMWQGRLNSLKDYSEYLVSRGSQGRLVPRGFPKNGKF